MFKNRLDTTQSCNNVDSIVIELPELAIVSLRCPPERIGFEKLVSFPVRPDTPSLIVSKSVPILLKECVDSRNTSGA